MSNVYRIIPVFVPHKGCPFDCVFCNQKKITGLSTDVTKENVEETVKEYIRTIPDCNEELEIAFYGGSFTAIDMGTQEELLEVAYRYKNKGLIDRIRLSTRPDYIDYKRLSLLKKYQVDTIELGVQSMDEGVLKKSNRGHTSNHVREAVELIREYKFNLGVQMMLGLPGDNKEKSLYTGIEIIKLKPDFVRIYPTLVVKDTYLEKLNDNGKYKPLSLNEAIDISSELLMLFKYYGITVIRIGLQPSENITLDGDVVAGPFHPAIRQLVESRVYREVLNQYFSENVYSEDIVIGINKKMISTFVGQKKENIKYIKEKYNISNIKVISEEIDKDCINIYMNEAKDHIVIKDYIQLYLEKRNLLSKVEYK
ncbi:elongator complex protein 3 [Caldisalinibacter kiritimatiensis]|uniref:Oxygen-independent coproporphyrinogen III oxidase n=1 Tax=Caldisalinibacter kiritimatiensis TaxID=1304284 RepID=R1CFZ5_9FIRM|nr:radical SAM protein [Caldisalinibacter kiritimatiensis]EOD01235.1 Oxygen-independent coproporphyrinogen III oxidase [Caldisalinibacter kiritimatiensis]